MKTQIPTLGFRDRREAGRVLASHFQKYAGLPNVVVLALPRGGVPVAYEVAKELGVPLARTKCAVPKAWIAQEFKLGHVSRVSRCWNPGVPPEVSAAFLAALET